MSTVNWAEIIVATVGTGGLAVVVPKAIEGWRAYKSGKAQEEKANNRSALSRLVIAEDRADDEMAYRRIISEFASQVIRIAIEYGVPKNMIPEWPKRPLKQKDKA